LSPKAAAYGGWEEPKCELRGHSLGHYLSACSLAYAATGEKAFKDRVDYIVSQMAECQAASPRQGFHEGYLSAYPESFFDRVENGQGVWAPWYTLHKVYAGLLDAYELCGNKQALQVLEKAAAWVQFRVDRLPEEQMQKSLQTEFGGMNEVLANLCAVTKNPDHLRLARKFDHRRVFDPLARREDRLDGLHANTQIPKMIGACCEYELTGERQYRDIAEFFWQRVALNRSYVIGGHSDRESFFPVQEFARHLSPETAETCNTYNMLKLTRHLFEWDPRAPLMDFYERGLYNHILASQDPRQGAFVYLMSLKPGHFKTYSTPEDSFWCCVGTGMENHVKYGDTIYAHDANSLWVNLFIASELSWKEKGLTLRQDTRFPESDTTRLTFRCKQPVPLGLKIRYPSWVAGAMQIQVNGKEQPITNTPGSYVTLQRKWRSGDRVEVRLPMALRTECLPGDDSQVALLYGPLVLAGRLGTNGMPNPYARNQTDQVGVPDPKVPGFLCNAQELLSHTQPVAGAPLTFQTHGVGKPEDVTLVPFYQVQHERYSVYWRLVTQAGLQEAEQKKAAAEAQRKRYEALTLDAVLPGDASEEKHDVQGEGTASGPLGDRKWRHAVDGGWFSYRMKVLPNEPMTLLCAFWGSDGGERTFDILVDRERLATQRLANNAPGEFFDASFDIPPALTAGKSEAVIKFQAHPGNFAGGLFGLRTLKKSPPGLVTGATTAQPPK
jgi:DUF1680 family protein